jgi:hypothetical protein
MQQVVSIIRVVQKCVRVAVRSCNPCPVANMAQFGLENMSKFFITSFETHVNGCVEANEIYVVDRN